MYLRALVFFLLFFVFSVLSIWAPTTPLVDQPPGEAVNAGDTAWMLTSSALVLLMTPGLSFFYAGMVRKKNVISTMLQSFITMGVVSLIWVTVGFSLSFGDSLFGVIGNPFTYLMFRGVGAATHATLSPTVPLAIFALFQLKFAIITPALVTGSFAERVRFSAYILFMGLFTLLVYCPLAHATWHPDGILRQFGVLDFAGGTVVHMSAGFAALAGAIALGRRADHVTGQAHPPAHIPYVLLGTGMLWFGWFGFNAGSALTASAVATSAFLTTNTASASAMLAWMMIDRARGLKPSALGACIGAVVGLVAITPAAGFVSVGPSIFIGVVASVISNIAVHWKSRSTLDDTLDVFPCHGVGGMVGMVATGMLASKAVNSAGADGLIFGGTELFTHHLIALVGVALYAFTMSFVIYKVIDLLVPMRVRPEEEQDGLDVSQHGESISSDALQSPGPSLPAEPRMPVTA
jgi:ammonium transporter, Amt family